MKGGIIWGMLYIRYCKIQPQDRFAGNELHYLFGSQNEHVFSCNICSVTVLGMGVRYRDGKCQEHSFCFWRSLIYLLFFKVLQYLPAFNHEQPELSCYWLILLDVHCPYWQAVHVEIFYLKTTIFVQITLCMVFICRCGSKERCDLMRQIWDWESGSSLSSQPSFSYCFSLWLSENHFLCKC